ncbi:PREDICTED: uncharacterized protein LOC105567235 [Vollenhovia emeryi]|uniref:uncharacterized protein LOC105567235 n=1 Tax=Vollenhovia emeryi TaxID=411798 RepID=UPI0005F55B58|nr:PREDICTED: uncharacterized protein LOC105567235 [Vollenhovia emeryi]
MSIEDEILATFRRCSLRPQLLPPFVALTRTAVSSVPPKFLKTGEFLFTKNGLESVPSTSKETENGSPFQKSVAFPTKISKQKAESSSNQYSESFSESCDHDSLLETALQLLHEYDSEESMRYGVRQREKEMKSDHSVAKKHMNNDNDCLQLSQISCSNQTDFVRCPSILSQCDPTLSKEMKLLWLQPRRDVGMWIECCRKNCRKWRYCDDYHDPVAVPKIWYCEMNSDKTIAHCSIPEVVITKEVEEDLIRNKYNAGSVVWARKDGYPWWPAIVDDCPEAIRYYELKARSLIPVKYHVTFINSKLRRTWLNTRDIRTFTKCSKRLLMKKLNGFDKTKYTKSLEKAYALASSAIQLSILERLHKFSFVSCQRNLRGLNLPKEQEE